MPSPERGKNGGRNRDNHSRLKRATSNDQETDRIAELHPVGGGRSARRNSGAGDLKFGLVASLSEPFTILGVQVRDGMKMAVDELNEKGGVLGRTLDLAERDDKNNPNEGITAFQYPVEREGIVAAGGMISSDVGLAVSRQAESLIPKACVAQ